MRFESSETLDDIMMNSYQTFSETELKAREKWMSEKSDVFHHSKRATIVEVPEDDLTDLLVTLEPMQIRTFVIEIKKIGV